MSTLEGCSGTKLPKVSMIHCGLTSYYRLHGLEKLFYDHSWSCGMDWAQPGSCHGVFFAAVSSGDWAGVI